MKLTREQAEELVEKDGPTEECKKLDELQAALAMHERILRAMQAEIQAGLVRKTEYKFTVKRDDNKLITEIFATPIGGK